MDACAGRAVVIPFTVGLSLAVSQTAFAQCGPRHAHRPVEDLFASDVVYLQEEGEVQAELKPARTREGGIRTTALEADLEYGPRDWWQIETEWDAREWTRGADGRIETHVGDAAIGTRFGWRCIGGSPYHLSVGIDLAIPSEELAEPRLARRHAAIQPMLILARELGRTAHVFTSIVVESPLNQRHRLPDWSYTSDTGMFVRMVRGFRATAEVAIDGGPEHERNVHFIPGVLWHRGDMIEIGMGMLTPVSRDTSRGVLAHVVCEFGGHHEAK